MLVLSRKAAERIKIGDNIVVEVRRVAGNRVTLAIEAPREIRILRGELEQAATDFEGAKPPSSNDQASIASAPVPFVDATPQADLSDHGMAAFVG
ncbi:MAG: carbon storage regulator [Planctomycetota bacterium]